MGTKQENATKHEAALAKMDTQLKAWSTQLDALVVGYLDAGAQASDPYRIRVDGLRTRNDQVQAKVAEFQAKAGPWGAFRSEIKEDWNALEVGFKDLTR